MYIFKFCVQIPPGKVMVLHLDFYSGYLTLR